MAKLSERQAWLELAKVFKNAPKREWFEINPGEKSWGICHAIDDLVTAWDYITWEMSRRMRARLERHCPPKRFASPNKSLGPLYCWKLGNWKSREMFCRKMAKLCTRKARR